MFLFFEKGNPAFIEKLINVDYKPASGSLVDCVLATNSWLLVANSTELVYNQMVILIIF